jgi:cis-L-3-hydroxyproline dehydratase
MRIEHIEVYQYGLTYAHGEYVMSGGRRAAAQESTLVRLLTDSGLEGWGEVATLGSTYLPAFAGSARAAIAEMSPYLIGADPTNLSAVHATMDSVLLGYPYAKSPIDIACWDLLGQIAGLPASVLLGGVANPSFPLYEAVPLGEPDDMAEFVQRRSAAGINAFQVKVGDEPRKDAIRVTSVRESLPADSVVIADANGGWSMQSAVIALSLMSDLDIYIEQPCRDHHDNVLLRDLCRLPLILDESVITTADLFRAKYEARASSVNLKLSRLGGLTAAKRMRDVAQDLGMSVCLEDTWGGDVTTAAVSHLAASTRPNLLLTTSFFNDWTNEHVAGYQPRSQKGVGSAPTAPGLGIAVEVSMLGEPILQL